MSPWKSYPMPFIRLSELREALEEYQLERRTALRRDYFLPFPAVDKWRPNIANPKVTSANKNPPTILSIECCGYCCWSGAQLGCTESAAATSLTLCHSAHTPRFEWTCHCVDQQITMGVTPDNFWNPILRGQGNSASLGWGILWQACDYPEARANSTASLFMVQIPALDCPSSKSGCTSSVTSGLLLTSGLQCVPPSPSLATCPQA